MINRIKTILSYNKAIEFYNKRMYKEACEIFKKIIENDPVPGGIHMKLSQFYYGHSQYKTGIFLFALGNFSGAAKAFEEAVPYNPDYFHIYEYLGICYNNIGKFDKAARAFENVISKEPAHMPLKLKLGITFHNLKMWDKAVKVCRDILEQSPCYANVWFYLGISLLANGKTSEAISAFETALKINPRYKEAQIRLGMTHACMKNFYDAFFHISLVMEENPGYPDLHYFLGIIYTGCGKLQNALDSFKRALEINPFFKDSIVKIGILYYKTGKTDDAVRAIQSACEHEPDNKNFKAILDVIINRKLPENIQEDEFIADIINNFNEHIEIKPNFAEMISIIKTFPDEDVSIYEMLIPVITDSLEHDSKYPDVYCNLGSLYFKLKRFEEAEEVFANAIKINPEYIQARIYYFKTLEKLGRFEDALKEGIQLLERNISYPDFYCTLGKVYFSLEIFDKAEEFIKKALLKNPDYAEARLVLAKILNSFGDTGMAVAQLQQCLASGPSASVEREAEKMLLKISRLIP